MGLNLDSFFGFVSDDFILNSFLLFMEMGEYGGEIDNCWIFFFFYF